MEVQQEQVQAVCWPLACRCLQLKHSTHLAAKRPGEKLRGERRHCDGDSNLEKRDLQGHKGSREEGMVQLLRWGT